MRTRRGRKQLVGPRVRGADRGRASAVVSGEAAGVSGEAPVLSGKAPVPSGNAPVPYENAAGACRLVSVPAGVVSGE